MRVTLNTAELKEVADDVGKLAFRARSRELLHNDDVRGALRASSARRFMRGLRQAGRQWRIVKRRRGLQDRPMRATGDAFIAITRGAGRKASAVEFTATTEGVRFGVKRGRSELNYVQVHARGYESSSGPVRPRRVVLVDRQAREGAARIVLERWNRPR